MEWWAVTAGILGAIVLISNALKATGNIFSPFDKLKKRVRNVEEKESSHEALALRRFEEIERIQREQENVNQMMLKALLAIVNHEIDGNSIEGLKAVRNELMQNIIER